MKMRHVANRRRSVSSRAFIALLALVLVIGCVAGGTVAWLVAKTEPVVNTFTYGNINITLAETTGTSYKIIPGTTIKKDPTVTVKSGSEACYLFVKVEQEGTFAGISYEIADGWTELESGVYYRQVGSVAADTSFEVIKGNEITVSETLTKENIPSAQPTLKITAYAVQQENIADAATAWSKIPQPTNP